VRRRPLLRALAVAVAAVLAAGGLLLVAPPSRVLSTIDRLSPGWLIASFGLELASCLSYPFIFRRFFPEPPRRVARRVAWIAMGAGAVLPGGNFSSAAATGWLLRAHGIGARRLAERCGSMLCFLTLFGFVVNGIAGILLLAGVGGGPHDLAHAGIPILVSLTVIALALAAMLAGRRGRAPALARSLSASLEGAWRTAVTPDPRLLGAAGFLCLDMAALWAACRATGHPIPPLALAVAYFVGYLATMIPVPAGLAVLDAGLAGALVLYGFSPAAAVGAVLVYHAFSVWIPGMGGLVAWLPIRGRATAAPSGAAIPPPAAAALEV
jgi:uncharacterized membrane protein YbhN (UPF0104 family)